jgi:competence protein ComEA
MIASLRRWGALLFVGLLLALPAVAQAQTLVNINTASAEELQTLPGIGPTKSAAILEYRGSHGAVASVEDLVNVNGIGAGTMNNLRALVTVGDGSAAPGPDPGSTEPGEFDDEPAIDLSGDGSSLGDPDGTTPPPEGGHDGPTAAPTGGLVNINTASADQLQTLPGIGATKANAIVEYRTQNGPFTSIDQLDNVPGIGPATMNTLRSLVTIE